MPELLKSLAETFRSRDADYGANYNSLAKVMVALFPNGITCKTEEEFLRFDFIHHIVSKLTRFTGAKMTHEDSIYDLSLYAIMLTAALHHKSKEEQ